MAVTFLKQILEKFCNHRFSWPHSGMDGRDYQVCLICGTIYEYDWARMCRTHRVPSSRVTISAAHVGISSNQH